MAKTTGQIGIDGLLSTWGLQLFLRILCSIALATSKCGQIISIFYDRQIFEAELFVSFSIG